MSWQRIVKQLVVVISTVLAAQAGAVATYADGGLCLSCGTNAGFGGSCGAGGCCSQNGCCPSGPCPAPLVHCTPKPPKIKFKCVCGKPICDPCDLEGYGYNPTCWRAWTPQLSCGNAGYPVLGCPPMAAPVMNQMPTQPGDVLPLPQKGNSDTLRQPQKFSGEGVPPNGH